jgi:membrane protease YdiL (CAAX protease family)
MGSIVFSTVLQVGFVMLIGLAFYGARHRRVRGYWHWLGLRETSWLALGLGLAGPIVLHFTLAPLIHALESLLDPAAVRLFAENEHTDANVLKPLGLSRSSLIVAALVKGLFQTSLSEELFFRGLIGKRLGNRFGFHAGNAVQAALFGGMHAAMPYLALPATVSRSGYAIMLFTLTGMLGWWLGYLNERLGRGSVLPSWAHHGLANGYGWVTDALT